jgi:hypothetical protein
VGEAYLNKRQWKELIEVMYLEHRPEVNIMLK